MDLIQGETNIDPLRAARQPEDDRHDEVVLRCLGAEKRFGGAVALRGASLELRAGEIHGLIGENGSGKSTLLNVISGQIRPDGGTVELAAAGGFRSLTGRDSSVAIVTQELSLAPDLTVAENIMMGRHSTRGRLGLSWRRLRVAAQETLDRLGVDVDVMTPASHLRVDQQQMVEIARAIQQDAPILILDEPTSSLSAEASRALFDSMSSLREQGVSIVFVSHRLEELFAMADRLTILRDGTTMSTGAIGDYDRASVIHHMTGHAPDAYEPAPGGLDDENVVLRVRGLSVGNLVDDVSFDLRSGEAIGLVGLSGSGQTEVLEALFGVRSADASGSAEDDSSNLLPRSPRQAMRRGLAFVPNDRKVKGLFMLLGPSDNINIAKSSHHFRLKRIGRSSEAALSAAWVERFSIAGGSRSVPVSALSDGNQQKVLLSKWLSLEPRVLMLDEPTRGVDVVAKSEIHRIVHQARDAGAAVLVSSSEIDELLMLCDRFVVLNRGRVVGTLHRDEATESRLTHMATEGRS
jgi:ABC-type sugar transport system ATPase subunit